MFSQHQPAKEDALADRLYECHAAAIFTYLRQHALSREDAEDIEETRRLLKEHHLTLPVLSAPQPQNSFFPDYKIHGTPIYYLINAKGQIQATGHPHENNPQWKQFVASLTKSTTAV